MPKIRKIAQDPSGAKQPAGQEDGILLLAVLFMLVLLTLALATAVPKITTQLRREKELEAVHRGEQYERAIGLYYRKFGHYPTSIKELLNTNGIRFLRKRYTDPFTGKDDWTLIHMGQAQMLGMPGRPSFGSVPGTSPGEGIPGSSPMGSSEMFSSSNSTSSANPMGGAMPGGMGGGSAGGPTSQNSLFSSTSSNSDSTSESAGSEGSDSMDHPGFGVGGGPIVGVGLPVKEKSIKILHGKQSSYNKWQFVYDPQKEQLQAAGILNGDGNQNGMGQGIGPGSGGISGPGGNSGFGGNSGSGFGSSSGFGGNSGFGGSSGFGNSGSGNSGSSSPPSQPDQP